MLCTLVTLYFAKEVPLDAGSSQRLSDSAPLLDDPHRMPMESKPLDNGSLSYTKNDQMNVVDHDGGFNDGPGAVMVKLLTSLRHLPPAMHSVLIVTALTWVCLSSQPFDFPCVQINKQKIV